MSIADAPARSGAKTAVQLVGRPFTYVRVTGSVENLSTGTATLTKSEEELRGVLTKVEWRLVDGSVIKATDQMLLVDAVSFEDKYGADAEPSTDDLVEIGEQEFSVVAVRTVSSGEQAALHKLVVRR